MEQQPLKSGTACYLVGLAGDFHFLSGRVVQVVGPDARIDDDDDEDGGAWMLIHAGWTHTMFQDRAVATRRCNLLPIAPPPEEERQHETETIV